MTERQYKILSSLFCSTEDALYKSLADILKKCYGSKMYPMTEALYAPGDSPDILLTAHIDTVFRHPVREIYHDEKKGVLWSPQGLGADDRAGIYAILEILRRGYRPGVLFTMMEEQRGKGVKKFLARRPQPKKQTNFIIALDRQGADDSVYYDLDNEEFEKYINSYGFKTTEGIFSDISIIGPIWKIPAVNLSVGYRHEHTQGEILVYKDLFNTIDKVCAILDAEKRTPHTFGWETHSFKEMLK